MSLYSSVAPSHRPDSSRLHGGVSGAALRVEIASGDPRRMAAAKVLVKSLVQRPLMGLSLRNALVRP